MTKTSSQNSTLQVQQRYSDNLARHVLGISLYMQTDIMHALASQHGHRGLRINFEPYLTLAGTDGARLSDIADLLGISRQAANQTANQIEAAGYLKREPDPSDGRAKLLIATPLARQVIEQGLLEANRLHQQMQTFVGKRRLQTAAKHVGSLNRALGLLTAAGRADRSAAGTIMAGLLPRLADYINIRLMQLTMAKGHPALKPSFGQVLTAIGPQGGRIQQIADYQKVSKQAISAVATELEELGYIRRVQDPVDARQLVLHFTKQGEKLIADSVASVEELLADFRLALGDKSLAELETVMGEIYRGWHLEEDVFGTTTDGSTDIVALAAQLKAQLGATGARELARELLAKT